MSRAGNNRERRALIRRAAQDGKSASEAGLSTGAHKQDSHGAQPSTAEMHEEKSKT